MSPKPWGDTECEGGLALINVKHPRLKNLVLCYQKSLLFACGLI